MLEEAEIKYVFKQICQGYDFLFNRGHYIHRDLKPENILIIDPTNRMKDSQNSSIVGSSNYLIDNKCIVKIADFGFVTGRD